MGYEKRAAGTEKKETAYIRTRGEIIPHIRTRTHSIYTSEAHFSDAGDERGREGEGERGAKSSFLSLHAASPLRGAPMGNSCRAAAKYLVPLLCDNGDRCVALADCDRRR